MTFDLKRPVICLITEGTATAENFEGSRERILTIIRIAVEENVSLVQIREKKLTAKLLFELSRAAAELTRGSSTRLVVNDRTDVADAAGADGVHLTASSMPASIVRKYFPKMLIGVSAHEEQELTDATAANADYAIFGPVFATPGKVPIGIEELAMACSKAGQFPVVAIGGIGETNFRDVLDAGAAGFAAIRSLNDPVRLRSITSMLSK